jgi:transcriptional regulator with XRE-family HTH domain
MDIGQRLRQVILLKNKTLKNFTSKTGMHYVTLQQYLSGNRKPNADALIKMIIYLDVNVNWLLTGEGPMYCHQLKEPIKEKKQEIKEINEDRAAYGADKSPGFDDVLDDLKNHWDSLRYDQKKVLAAMFKEMIENNEIKKESRKIKETIRTLVG